MFQGNPDLASIDAGELHERRRGAWPVRAGAGSNAFEAARAGTAANAHSPAPAAATLREVARVLGKEPGHAGPIVPFATISLRWRLGTSGAAGLELCGE